MKINLEHLIKTSTCCYEPEYGMSVLMYDGIAWGPPTTVELVEAVKAFPLHCDDVLVTGYPKSGTNWMQIMLANLHDDWGTYRLTGSRRVPSIEYIGAGTDGYDIAVASPSPRLMKNHLPVHAMPIAWPEAKSRVIYMTRNPFDSCVSFYGQLQVPGLGFEGQWDPWVERFASGQTLYGGWLKHVLGWHTKSHADGVYHLTYEDLRRDPLSQMRKITEFLKKPVSDDRLRDVVEKALMENMDKSGFSEQITVADLSHYRHGGTVGEGQKQFSAHQVARFREAILAPLNAAGISNYNI